MEINSDVTVKEEPREYNSGLKVIYIKVKDEIINATESQSENSEVKPQSKSSDVIFLKLKEEIKNEDNTGLHKKIKTEPESEICCGPISIVQNPMDICQTSLQSNECNGDKLTKAGKKGLIIHRRGREIIKNVSEFMKKEAEDGITIPLKQHRTRTVAATRVSKSTYSRIQKESTKVNVDSLKDGASTFSTPRKKRPRIARKLGNITPAQINSIRDIIYDHYITEKRQLTLKHIRQKIFDRGVLLDETISVGSVRTLLGQMGFKWQKTADKLKVLIENHDIRLKRSKYLKEIANFRTEGWNIVYMGETYIHSSHTQAKGVRKPVSKGQKLMILHASGESGFIPNGLWIFQSAIKPKDGNDEMNNIQFMTWVEKQLLPNLPPKSVLVIGNEAYQNVPVKSNVSAASKKIELIEWLQERNIPTNEDLSKPEIYEIVQQNKFRFPIKYKLDDLLEKHEHKVLRLPPHHSELNPMEKIWVLVKNWVASKNITLKLTDVEQLTRQKLSEITSEELTDICEHVKKQEEELLQRDHLFDDAIDSMQFTVNTNESSDESEIESESSVLSDSE